MRVCVLATSFPRWQGDVSGLYIFEPLRRLVARGVEVDAVVPHSHGARTYEVMEGVHIHRFRFAPLARWQKLGYENGLTHALRFSTVARLQLPFFMFAFVLKAALVARRCDVVHAHWVLSGLVALISQMVVRRPYLLSLRGSDVNIGLSTNGLARRVFGLVGRRSKTLISVSRAISAAVERELRIDDVLLLENGVNLETYRPSTGDSRRSSLGLPEGARVILSVGNLVALKGYNFVISALPAIADANPQAMVVLIGEGQERKALMEQAVALGVADRVRFTGYLPPAQIPDWLNAADVFVLPSLSEGRPNVILEALACGRPVVATRVGGIPEIVDDGRTGFLVEPQQPDQLAERIGLLLNDRELGRRIGRAGRQSLIDKGLTWDHHVDRLVEIYADALGRGRRRQG